MPSLNGSPKLLLFTLAGFLIIIWVLQPAAKPEDVSPTSTETVHPTLPEKLPAKSRPWRPDPGSLQKYAIVLTMNVWTTIKVENITPIRTSNGRLLQRGDRCWTSKESKLEALGRSEGWETKWVLFVLRRPGWFRNPHGESVTCPPGTLFLMNGPLAEQYAQYTEWRSRNQENLHGHDKEADDLIKQYDRQHR